MSVLSPSYPCVGHRQWAGVPVHGSLAFKPLRPGHALHQKSSPPWPVPGHGRPPQLPGDLCGVWQPGRAALWQRYDRYRLQCTLKASRWCRLAATQLFLPLLSYQLTLWMVCLFSSSVVEEVKPLRRLHVQSLLELQRHREASRSSCSPPAEDSCGEEWTELVHILTTARGEVLGALVISYWGKTDRKQVGMCNI